jgi:SAM-dependent methyltransferase
MVFGRRTLLLTSSPFNGEIRVEECGGERLLLINGETHSIHSPANGWKEARREVWGVLAAPPFPLRPNPEVLMLGLGGGTTLHLLASGLRPSAVVAVDADPEIVRIAREYFDVPAGGTVTLITGDALETMRKLAGDGRTFDLLIDDVYFTATTTTGPPGSELFATAKRLVRPGGTALFNRPLDHPRPHPEHGRFAAELRGLGHEVVLLPVRRRWSNDIICCRM